MNYLTITLVLLLAISGVVSAQGQVRTEKDLLGEKQVPADAYYGVQTAELSKISKYPGFPSVTMPGSWKPGPS